MHLQNKHHEELIQLELTADPRTSPSKLERKKKERKSVKRQGNMYASDIDGSLTVSERSSNNIVDIGDGELVDAGKRTHSARNSEQNMQNCTTLEVNNICTSKSDHKNN